MLREANFALVGDLAALQGEHAELGRLQALLRQLSKNGQVWVSKMSLVDAHVELVDVRTVEAEVKRAAEWFWSAGGDVASTEAHTHRAGETFGLAWSRYQQENKHELS